MNILDKFKNIAMSLESLGLIRRESFSKSFCTPENAIIFAELGLKGIHYCILPKNGDTTLENSPVYEINPNLKPHVFLVAENFNDFLSIVVRLDNLTKLSLVNTLNDKDFYEKLKKPEEYDQEYLDCFTVDEIEAQEEEFQNERKSAIAALQEEFFLNNNISDIYYYIKNLRDNYDDLKTKKTNFNNLYFTYNTLQNNNAIVLKYFMQLKSRH